VGYFNCRQKILIGEQLKLGRLIGDLPLALGLRRLLFGIRPHQLFDRLGGKGAILVPLCSQHHRNARIAKKR
jgi:hypothetical protein